MSTAVGTDVDQVVAVATEYLTSFYSGSAEERAARIERVLHPLLAKRSPSYLHEDGTFFEWTIPIMIEAAAGSAEPSRRQEWGWSDPPKPHSVKVLDVSGDMASVRTDAEWGVDFMHLVRVDGQWKVVNVLWDSA